MDLTVIRTSFSKTTTIGSLFVDGARFCYTLEDVVRPGGAAKVPGKTAIPTGTYEVVINTSPRFGKRMPLLLSVPDFTGVRIHPGNNAGHTEGCLLIGYQKHGRNSIGLSKPAFKDLMEKMEKAIASGDKVSISITNGAYIYDLKPLLGRRRVIV